VLEVDRAGGTTGERLGDAIVECREKIAAALMREAERLLDLGILPSAPDPMSVMLVLAGIETISIRYLSEGRRAELIALHPMLFKAVQGLFPNIAP